MAHGEHFRASIIIDDSTSGAIVNNYGYADLTGGSVHLDMGIAAGVFQTLVQEKYAAFLPTTCKIVKYRFACVFSPSHLGEIGFVEPDEPVFGGAATIGMLPAEMAIAIRRNCGTASRMERGRIFLGPVSATYRSLLTNQPDMTSSVLNDFTNLVKAGITVSGTALSPIIVDADGDSTEKVIINSSIGPVFVHRRSRRPGVGT